MPAKTKKATSVKMRGRVKVNNIKKTGKELHARELKKIKGGAKGPEDAKVGLLDVKGSMVNIN